MRDKLIIAGSRSLNPTIAQISRLITELPSLVICGCADGVDKAGCAWARHFSVPVEFFPAWPIQMRWALANARGDEIVHKLPFVTGRGAGMARNNTMSHAGSKLLLYWDGRSPGSRDMRDAAMRRNLPITNHVWRSEVD